MFVSSHWPQNPVEFPGVRSPRVLDVQGSRLPSGAVGLGSGHGFGISLLRHCWLCPGTVHTGRRAVRYSRARPESREGRKFRGLGSKMRRPADSEFPERNGITWPETPSIHLYRISIQTSCRLRILETGDQNSSVLVSQIPRGTVAERSQF